MGHRSEGGRVLTRGERSTEVPFQATGGGKPEKETLYYDSFPSSLKTFSCSRANTSSFSAATRSQRRILSLGGADRALLRAPLPSVAASSRPKLVLEVGPLNLQEDADPTRPALLVGG